MTNNLPSVPGKFNAIWRIMKAAGPLLLAQSTKLSEEYARHRLRLAEVDAMKELMIGEARTNTEIRKKLIEKYIDAAPEDRLRLRQDIEMVEKDLRQLGVYQKAIEYLPDGQTSSTIEDLGQSDKFIAWIDRFNEYARKQNEPWRVDLLARALALEASSTSVVGQRALWFIGTVDEIAFHSFAAVLDIAPKIDGDHTIPERHYIDSAIPTCFLGADYTLGGVLYLLDDLGLIGDMASTIRTYESGESIEGSYAAHRFTAVVKQRLYIQGVILTSLGNTIAKLYEPKVNDLGLKIYTSWLNQIRGSIEVTTET
jgi:hypothetical protein